MEGGADGRSGSRGTTRVGAEGADGWALGPALARLERFAARPSRRDASRWPGVLAHRSRATDQPPATCAAPGPAGPEGSSESCLEEGMRLVSTRVRRLGRDRRRFRGGDVRVAEHSSEEGYSIAGGPTSAATHGERVLGLPAQPRLDKTSLATRGAMNASPTETTAEQQGGSTGIWTARQTALIRGAPKGSPAAIRGTLSRGSAGFRVVPHAGMSRHAVASSPRRQGVRSGGRRGDRTA